MYRYVCDVMLCCIMHVCMGRINSGFKLGSQGGERVMNFMICFFGFLFSGNDFLQLDSAGLGEIWKEPTTLQHCLNRLDIQILYLEPLLGQKCLLRHSCPLYGFLSPSGILVLLAAIRFHPPLVPGISTVTKIICTSGIHFCFTCIYLHVV